MNNVKHRKEITVFKNRAKIIMLKLMHDAVNDSINKAIEKNEDWTELETTPTYSIGIGEAVYKFPATIAYRVAFDALFEALTEMAAESSSGIEGYGSDYDNQSLEDIQRLLDDPDIQKMLWDTAE